jgi:hypothetical protein
LPSCAARMAATYPPGPAPKTRTSVSFMEVTLVASGPRMKSWRRLP